jgi:hypothetical protein
MKVNRKQTEDAVLFFAKLFNQEKNYRYLINTEYGMPEVVKNIVYEMFLQKFNPHTCIDDQYEQYKLIHEYVIELNQNGFVTYEPEPYY